jgi:hypothetical protein
MQVANVRARIERSSDRLVGAGLRLKEMLADGRIDERELRELPEMAQALLDEAVEVGDVAEDIAFAKQALNLGRKKTPNRTLRERDQQIELLKNLRRRRMRGQKETPAGLQSVEVDGHRVFDSIPE